MDAIRIARLLHPHTEMTVILRKDSPSEHHYRSQLESEGIRVESIAFVTALSLPLILKLRHMLRRHNIRNILFFGASELRSLYFSIQGLAVNLMIRHGTTKTHPKKDPFHQLIYSRVNWHIAICQHIARNVRQIIPFGRRTQLRVIYSSLRNAPASRLPTMPEHGQPIRILHVGRVTGGKGQIDAIQACGILEEQGIPFQLQFAGEIDPGIRGDIDKALSSIAYRDKVEFLGHVSDPRPLYRTSHIFLFPSHGEGLSNAFIEALAEGLVCVAYDNTSFPELQGLGFDILLASDRDSTDLSRKLIEAVSVVHSSTRRKKNQALAKHLFDARRELREYLSLIS